MSTVKFQDKITITLAGEQPKVGTMAPNFELVRKDLSTAKLSDYRGKRVVLNIFPSIDTGVCAASVRRFNAEAAKLDNTVVLCISQDLPFAQARFCGAEGLDNVETLSTFRCCTVPSSEPAFCKSYGLMMQDGPLAGLQARCVIVIDAEGKVIYEELVPEITQEPNYDKAIAALK